MSTHSIAIQIPANTYDFPNVDQNRLSVEPLKPVEHERHDEPDQRHRRRVPVFSSLQGDSVQAISDRINHRKVLVQ